MDGWMDGWGKRKGERERNRYGIELCTLPMMRRADYEPGLTLSITTSILNSFFRKTLYLSLILLFSLVFFGKTWSMMASNGPTLSRALKHGQ